jgi:hypothetical protein
MVYNNGIVFIAIVTFAHLCLTTTLAFPTRITTTPRFQRSILKASTDTNTGSIRAPPRTGLAQKLLNVALKSPLWKYVLVPQARQTMVKTAEVGSEGNNDDVPCCHDHAP